MPACAQAAFPRLKEMRSAAWRTGRLDAFRSGPAAEMKGGSYGLGGLPGSGCQFSETGSEGASFAAEAVFLLRSSKEAK